MQTIFITAGSYIEKMALLTLNSVDSYMRAQNMPAPTTPEERLYMRENAKKPFYAKIVPAAPILMQYILESDLTTNQQAIALDYAYSQHILDRDFIDALMMELSQPGQTAGSRAAVGAYLTLRLNDFMEEKEVKKIQVPTTVAEKNKDTKEIEKKTVMVEKEVTENVHKPEDLKYITEAIQTLLGSTANWIQNEYPTLTDQEAIAVTAAVFTANDHSIAMLVKLNIAITAKVFNLLDNDGQYKIIESALNLKKDDFQKLTSNQSAFIESLKKWVYGKLDYISTTECVRFLNEIYGLKPTDLGNRLIYLKDCGTSYVKLLQVAKQLES